MPSGTIGIVTKSPYLGSGKVDGLWIVSIKFPNGTWKFNSDEIVLVPEKPITMASLLWEDDDIRQKIMEAIEYALDKRLVTYGLIPPIYPEPTTFFRGFNVDSSVIFPESYIEGINYKGTADDAQKSKGYSQIAIAWFKPPGKLPHRGRQREYEVECSIKPLELKGTVISEFNSVVGIWKSIPYILWNNSPVFKKKFENKYLYLMLVWPIEDNVSGPIINYPVPVNKCDPNYKTGWYMFSDLRDVISKPTTEQTTKAISKLVNPTVKEKEKAARDRAIADAKKILTTISTTTKPIAIGKISWDLSVTDSNPEPSTSPADVKSTDWEVATIGTVAQYTSRQIYFRSIKHTPNNFHKYFGTGSGLNPSNKQPW